MVPSEQRGDGETAEITSSEPVPHQIEALALPHPALDIMYKIC